MYALKAGFRGAGLATIVAIAMAESGGNSGAICNNCAGVQEHSVGLVQVNTDAHPNYTTSQLLDPLGNLKAAYAISNGGTNFAPWSTFTSGSYMNYATVSENAAYHAQGPSFLTSAVLNASNTNMNAGGIYTNGSSNINFMSIWNFIRAPFTFGWTYVIEIIAGSIIIIFGLVLFAGNISSFVPSPIKNAAKVMA